MHRPLVVLALILAGSSAIQPLRAQSPAPVSVGERVRITTPSERGAYRLVGNVVAARPDTLLLQISDVATPRAVAIGDISTLEVSRGRRGNGRRGMLYGLAIGAGAGALLGAATYRKPDCAGSSLCPSPDGPALDIVAGGILGGVVGVGAGGLWGASHPSERWQARTLGTAPRVGFFPARRGAMVVVRATI